MRTKTVFWCLIAGLVVALMVAACAPAKEAPPPLRKPVSIRITAGPMGSDSYVLSFTLATMINEASPWLRAQAAETAGSTANLKELVEYPELRNSLLIVSGETTNAQAVKGLPPYGKVYTGARAVAMMHYADFTFATYDKRIKTKDDFKGKRIMNTSPALTIGVALDSLLKDVWGILGDVSISRGDFAAGTRALRDGTVDLAAVALTGFPGMKRSPNAALLQLMQEKPGLRLVGVSAEDVRAVAEKTGMPFSPDVIEAGVVGPEQIEAVPVFMNTFGWWADETMDEDIVYEICRIIYENPEKFKERWASAVITKENMGRVPVPVDLFHPGAAKFYKEKGVKIGPL